MATITREQAETELKARSGDIDKDGLGRVLSKQQAIEAKASQKGPLRRFIGDIRVMFSMLRDYWKGNYRAVPWKSIAAIAGALLYVLNPIDLIPDLIIGFGFLDDAAILAACLTIVESDLHDYEVWKAQQDGGSVGA
ncbi:MAG: YkvA family protein [Marinobacter sp.]|uniref:YkvA family protein n=1 Tax=Marinobacter sp. TaxID=50741 RepID=UPI0034A00374